MERRGLIDSFKKRFNGVNQDALPSSVPDEYPDIEPAVEPIVIYECKDTRLLDVYNQSVMLDWEQTDPAGDRPMNSQEPTRIHPSA